MTERLVRNPLAGPVDLGPPPAGPLAFHRTLPGYAPTPLVEAPAAAAALGVRRVMVKDESSRLGLPSFKVLGASWAIHRALQERPETSTLACATDGNHGRAVARMARLLGLEATVLVPASMLAARREAIAAEGARVEVVDGTYDEAVERAAQLDALVIQDTAWPGYETVPAWVVEGYSTIGAEIDLQPDLVGVQIGVGSFAAAMVRRFAGARIVGVEPVSAACALASIEAGEPAEVPGPHDSVMAGLNCGRVSPVALAGGEPRDRGVLRDRRRPRARGGGAAGARRDRRPARAGRPASPACWRSATSSALPADATVLVVNTEGDTTREDT